MIRWLADWRYMPLAILAGCLAIIALWLGLYPWEREARR